MQESDNYFQDYLSRLSPKERKIIRRDIDWQWVIEHSTEQDLALRFENTARASRAFSWLGVVLNTNSPRGYELDVYLSERAGIDLTELEGEALADSVDYFGDFSIKRLDMGKTIVRLRLVRDSRCSLEELKQRLMETEVSSKGKQKLLCEVDLFLEGDSREEQSKRLLEIFAEF